MTQHELNRAVAWVTGESLREVRRHGFSVADPLETDFDPEPNEIPAQTIDWDNLDARRSACFE